MYIIHRIEKCHSIEGRKNHIDRTLDTYINNVDKSKSNENVTLKSANEYTTQGIKERFKARKNAVLGIEGIYTASPDFFKGKTKGQINAFFKDCIAFHKEHYGHEIIAAAIHYDEKTPHLHIITIPEYEGKLNAKHYTANPKLMAKIQTDIYKEVGIKWGLERGEYNSRQAHKDTIVHIKEQLSKENDRLIKEKENIKNMTLEKARKIIEEYERQQENLIL